MHPQGFDGLKTLCVFDMPLIMKPTDIVYKVIVFYNEARAICALSFGLLRWQSGSGSIAEKLNITQDSAIRANQQINH